MTDALIRLSAGEAVARLKAGEITPLELIDAAAERIAEVEPHINALPTLCLERGRDHARRLMDGEADGGFDAGTRAALERTRSCRESAIPASKNREACRQCPSFVQRSSSRHPSDPA